MKKLFFLSMFVCFSLPGWSATNSFDKFVGTYKVLDQTCIENHVATTIDCDLKEVRIEYKNNELYLTEVSERSSMANKIYLENKDYSYSRGQYVFKIATMPDLLDCDSDCALWELDQEERLLSPKDSRLYSHIFKQSRQITRENEKVVYSFWQYESRNGTGKAPNELLRTYTLKMK
jgi:hypothetical protein